MPDRAPVLALAARFCVARPPKHWNPVAISVIRADQRPVHTRAVEHDWERPWRHTWESVIQNASLDEDERQMMREALQEYHQAKDDRPIPTLVAILAELLLGLSDQWQEILPEWWRPQSVLSRESSVEETDLADITIGENHNAAPMAQREDGLLRDALSLVLRRLGQEGERLAAKNDEMSIRELFTPAPNAPIVRLGIIEAESQLIHVRGPDPFTCPALRRIALAVWRDHVAPKRAQRARLPALPVLVASALIAGPCGRVELITDAETAGRGLLRRTHAQGVVSEIHTHSLHQGAVMEIDAVRALIERGVKELDTVRPLRFIPWLVAAVQQRAQEEAPLVVEGGGAGLAQQLGEDPERHGTAYRALAHIMSRLYLHISTGTYQLYSLNEERQTRNRPARLIFVPGLVLLSGRIRDSLQQGSARALVPLPLDLPPLGGSPNSLAARGRMWWAILVELRRQADLLASDQGVRLPREALSMLAQKVELPPGQIEPTIRALIEAQALISVGEDRYDLGPRYPDHRRMLVESGKLMSSGQAAGRLSASRRRQRFVEP